jgi:hypothetical protein
MAQKNKAPLSPTKMLLINIFGWYGVVAYQVAYILISFHVVDADSIIYQLINLTGGLGLFVISLIKRAHQPAVSNLIWSIIATIALINILLNLPH